MGVLARLEQQSARAQVFDDHRVGIFDEHSAPWRHIGDERPIGENGHQDGQIVRLRHFHVFLTERGRDVHQARAVFGCDEISQHNVMRGLVGRHEREQRMIFYILQLLAFECVNDFHFLFAEHFLHQRLHEDQLFFFAIVIALDGDILLFGVRGNSDVGRQCPRGCRPHEQ